MTSAQILIGFGLIVLLAVGSQVLASRLRIPALILLLPAGFTAGALTTDVNPQHLLGTSAQLAAVSARYQDGARSRAPR
jgi:NhaP-type Na+/H+ or K+/H+ antiporter